MADPTIRRSNVAILMKIETTEGTDAAPTASDAITFEEDGYSYNYPYTSEDSNEATGSLAAGAPLIVGQPAQLSIRVRMKGANAGYTASIKPPHHVLFTMCGLRGLFTSAVSAAALTAGTATSATLGTGFGTTAQMYRGMPLILTGAPAAGAVPFITDYTAGKVATLTDQFGSALSASNTAALPANWTYAPTSPKDVASRATDQPSATIYIYEDGTLHKFVACRGVPDELSADTAKPGFFTAKISGIYGGKSDASIPSGISLPGQLAPTLTQGLSNPSGAFLVNRYGLPISNMSLKLNSDVVSPEDPNTNYGFGAGIIQERKAQLTCDPLATLVATRDILSVLNSGSIFPAVARFGAVANNRWALTMPSVTPASADPTLRGTLRAETQVYQGLSNSQDANTRDTDFVLCFY